MLISNLINQFLERIKAAQEAQEHAKAEVGADARLQREAFATALRKRIEADYDVRITIIDMDQWIIEGCSVNTYSMTWKTDEGSVMVDKCLTTEEVKIEAFGWTAYHKPTRWTASFDNLIAALVYAGTGKHL